MPILSVRDRVHRIQRYCVDDLVDIAIQLRIKETGHLSPVYGGRWHKTQGRYLEPWEIKAQILRAGSDPLALEKAAFSPLVVDVSLAQFDLISDFATPLIMILGGRRGGKSRGNACKAAVHLACMAGVAGQLVSPTFKKSRIMWDYILKIVPSEWIDGSPHETDLKFRLWNAAALKMFSAFKPDSLVGEGVGWMGLDESQNIPENAWQLALPALSDGGKNIQCWQSATPRLGDFKLRHDRFMALPDEIARIARFSYRDNPFIETGKGSVFDLARSVMDEKRRMRELDALFEPEEGLVYYRFDRGGHGRSWASARKWCSDITKKFCIEELDVAVDYVIGVDYGIGRQFATVFKIVDHRGLPCMFAIAEVYLYHDSDVQALGEALRDRGFWPAAVIDDASGPKSRGGRSASIRHENIKAVRSRKSCKQGDQIFHVFHHSRNPRRIDRVDSVNALMQNELGQVRFFIDPVECADLVRSFENLELVRGRVKRDMPGSIPIYDPPDSAGYPMYYLFPAEIDYIGLEMIA